MKGSLSVAKGCPGLRVTARLAVLLLALAVFLPGRVAAQVSTATITVRVEDENKAAIPGVSVTLTGTETGLKRAVLTEDLGEATIAAVPPGLYQLQFELAGFETIVQKDIVLRVGQQPRFTVVLKPKSVEQEVVVTAQAPLVDVYKVDSSTNILPEQIESLPILDRDFQRLAFITPGVQRERGGYRFISGGPVIGAAGNASQATILVDGVDLTDQALGLARTRYSQDAIREFKVVNNRFDAEVGGTAGGGLSIVTKTGTNDFSGTFFGFYRADDLRSKGALELSKTPYSRGQYGFTMGGPIVKDRTHFFISTEYIDENNFVLFRPGGAYKSLAADIKHPFQQLMTFMSLTHKINEKQQFSAKFVYERYREKNFRVGGVSDESNGQSLNRDNWNLTLEHVWAKSNFFLNELRFQVGYRKYAEPLNSQVMEEWFTNGTTLKTGSNTLGDLLGKGSVFQALDTMHFYFGKHELKVGMTISQLNERSRMDVYQNGLMIYVTDTRAIPLAYAYGIGSSDVDKATTLIGAFVQDNWKVLPTVTIYLGLRYDLDTSGNNPNFTHPLVPNGRTIDSTCFQPRFGFTWDLTGSGRHVVRGGVGRFTGRYLLVPAFTELQQNGITGRRFQTRINYPPAFPLDPKNPTTTGFPLKSSITLMDQTMNAPYADQATLGYTAQLWHTGLYFDTEAIYVRGRNEIIVRDKNWSGNATHTRPNTTWDQINTYTNEGHSDYKALTFSLNGQIKSKHIVTAALTLASKKNINDDFSPELPNGYPSDPANIEGEYGRSRNDERWHFVLTSILQCPWKITVAPVFEYGSGQPWNARLGYDYNGDGKAADRAVGVARNSMDGPRFCQFNIRVNKLVGLHKDLKVNFIFEVFNLFNTTNYDVNSVDTAQYYNGPTITNPTQAYIVNPNFGKYSSTLRSREIQLGVKFQF